MKKQLLLLLCSALLLSSCNFDDYSNVKIPIDTTLPLLDADITADNLIDWGNLSEVISTNQNGVLQTNSVIEFNFADISDFSSMLNLPSQNFTFRVDPNTKSSRAISIPIPTGTEFKGEFNLNNGMRLDNVMLGGGEISLNADRSTFRDLTITIPEITQYGRAIEIRVGEPFYLQGAMLSFENKGESTNNAITFQLSGDINLGSTNPDLEVSIAMTNLYIEGGVGYFGRNVIDPQKEFIVEFDSEITSFFGDAEIRLDNPNLSMDINNEFDIPILLEINSLRIGDNEIDLIDKLGYSKFYIKNRNSSVINISNNSTISGKGLSNALDQSMSNISIRVNVITNPSAADLGDSEYTPPTTNEINFNMAIGAKCDIAIPLSGYFKDIAFEQTMQLNLNNGNSNNSNSNIDNLKLAILSKNSFALEFLLDLYTVDQFGAETKILDEPIKILSANQYSLSDPLFKSGVVDRQNVDIKALSGNQANKLMNASSVKVKLRASSFNAAEKIGINIYSDAKLNLNIIINPQTTL